MRFGGRPAMAREQFELKLDGKGVSPETVDVDDLFVILSAYRTAIVAMSKSLNAELDDAVILSLVGVRSGSDRLSVSIPSAAKPSATQISRAVQTGDWSRCSPDVRANLTAITKQLAANGRTFALPLYRRRPALLTGTTPIPQGSPPLTLTGPTTLYGEVREAGGKEPHAELVLPNNQTVRVEGERDTIKKLGAALFEPISLNGEATWDAVTGRITKFRVDSWSRFNSESLQEGLVELAAVAGNRWEGTEAVKYVRQLRKVAE